MANGDWTADRSGQVWAIRPGDEPPVSSLVEAFEGLDVSASDAIVLQGYLGRSDILTRAVDYLVRARRIALATTSGAAVTGMTESILGGTTSWYSFLDKAASKVHAERVAHVRTEARRAGVPANETNELVEFLQNAAPGLSTDAIRAWLVAHTPLGWTAARELAVRVGQERAARIATTDVATITKLIDELAANATTAQPHIPWRLYLTPRLDRYVDFHQSSLIAWRREPKAERQDACTVWLRVFEQGAQVPIPYKLVSETTLVPSFATWISGQLVDDYGSQAVISSAWGDQTVGGLKNTGPGCLRKTGPGCLE